MIFYVGILRYFLSSGFKTIVFHLEAYLLNLYHSFSEKARSISVESEKLNTKVKDLKWYKIS